MAGLLLFAGFFKNSEPALKGRLRVSAAFERRSPMFFFGTTGIFIEL